MTTEERIPPRFVDGVEKLHSELCEAYKKAAKLANSLLGELNLHTSFFMIYVDFAENQSEHRIRGYFAFNFKILRFLQIEFDYALLFPVKNHGGGNFYGASGISFTELKQAKAENQKLFIRFSPIRDLECDVNKNLYTTKILKLTRAFDDIGLPYYKFSDIDKLSIVDVSTDYINKKYTLVGKQHYAPYTRETEIDCVLFAELDNEYDTNAIKVLRWFPMKRSLGIDHIFDNASNGGDYFFELGYISRSENIVLHNYMISENSRILFGKIKDNKITITGGVKQFMDNDLKYPRCLYNVKLK